MGDGEDMKIKHLPVKYKTRGKSEKFLVLDHTGCSHAFGPFLIDDKEEKVECGRCGEKLNPMYVLKRLAVEENRWHELHKTYQEEMKRLAERSRTKCDYCGNMTRISKS